MTNCAKAQTLQMGINGHKWAISGDERELERFINTRCAEVAFFPQQKLKVDNVIRDLAINGSIFLSVSSQSATSKRNQKTK